MKKIVFGLFWATMIFCSAATPGEKKPHPERDVSILPEPIPPNQIGRAYDMAIALREQLKKWLRTTEELDIGFNGKITVILMPRNTGEFLVQVVVGRGTCETEILSSDSPDQAVEKIKTNARECFPPKLAYEKAAQKPSARASPQGAPPTRRAAPFTY